MKKLRIAQIAPLWEPVPPKKYGGIEIMMEKIINELVRRGHSVTLFASGNSKTKAKLNSVFPKSLIEMNVDWYHRSQNLINVSNAFRLADQFDVIHNHAGDNAMFFTQGTKTPVVTTLHNVLPTVKSKESDEYIAYKYFAKKTNFISISLNQRMHTDIKFNFVDNVYNGIDVDKFKFSPKYKDYFFWLGRIHYGKGLAEAVEVARKIKQKLIIAGNITCKSDEEYFAEIKSKIDGKNIKYVGEVSEKQKIKYFSNAKALLFPIRWEEPFGLVMAEAMACGAPVIAFNRGSVSEVVKNGKTGFVVKNEKEMINAIKNIDKIKRENCRAHVEKKFTIEKMVDNYEKVYEKIIKNK